MAWLQAWRRRGRAWRRAARTRCKCVWPTRCSSDAHPCCSGCARACPPRRRPPCAGPFHTRAARRAGGRALVRGGRGGGAGRGWHAAPGLPGAVPLQHGRRARLADQRAGHLAASRARSGERVRQRPREQPARRLPSARAARPAACVPGTRAPGRPLPGLRQHVHCAALLYVRLEKADKAPHAAYLEALSGAGGDLLVAVTEQALFASRGAQSGAGERRPGPRLAPT